MLSVNSGHIIIMPQHPLPLAGFADRKQNYEAVSDNLEINLVAIRQGSKLYLIYAVDTLFVPETFVQAVKNSIAHQYHIGESHIWMCASHTHFAPSIDAEKPVMGLCDEDYYNYVKEKLIQLTLEVLSGTFSEAGIEYGQGNAALNVNRRKKLLRLDNGKLKHKTLLLPDYEGNKDSSLHVLKFVGKDDRVLACIWSYACHPVHSFAKNNVSAEYIGYVRGKMREHINNEDLTVGFLQGFAGNLKADITAVTNTLSTDKLRYLLQLWPKHIAFPSAQAYASWAGLLWRRVETVFSSTQPLSIDDNITASIHEIPLSDIIGDYNDRYIIFKKLSLGKDVVLVSISAEVVTEYMTIVKALFPGKHVIGVAYTEATRTYLPVDSMLPEKGYEVEGFKPLFSIEGDFKYSLNRKVADAIAALK